MASIRSQADVERMVAALKQSGADVALGSRFCGQAVDALRVAAGFTQSSGPLSRS